ncbi:protein translocase subunit SecD [Piscinibacter terrae]|uniref:Protein translocase subunit SecD n=1 Tax=Piscinibacter terrae TaxID=2496871 RepID=A0A3N7HYY8_9BURK|nr:protein translocase subunit SecD [Albitalea terrae]RQP26646.1 protein translocase subunit SecD [Albitalea terrae]
MNRYPLWKYAMLVVALLVGLLYTLPNFFGESPAVQVSSGKATVRIGQDTVKRVEQLLADAKLQADFVQLEGNSVKARFKDGDSQLKAKDMLAKALNPDSSDETYVVALNLVSRSPHWMASIRALPMYLGLDLRGGVHFLLQVDMKAAVNKRMDALVGDIRTAMREKTIRGGTSRDGNTIVVTFRDQAAQTQAQGVFTDQFTDLQWTPAVDGADYKLIGALKPTAIVATQDAAIKQNMTTLHNRVNELGVAEPVIQQQGADRIVVELPGIQDTAKAKDIIGRTANLEFRLADRSAEALSALDGSGPVPFGREKYTVGRNAPVVVFKDAIATGEMLTNAQPRPDNNQQPAVSVSLDAKGGRLMKETTRNNIGKPMAAILFEKGKGEVLTVATIQGEFGSEFQITGMGTTENAAQLALLLRAGALAAPMEFIEESTVGPTLGADNIAQGFNSLIYGFAAIALFMCAYYLLFGMFSTLALMLNLLLLVAVLSMLQATLTLPGIAAIALTLGMAIDANVLINERVREELRNGAAPQTAINAGYERAFATILDSNVTTLIAGLALLAFGSGPVKGFAVVHCLGILTSMFSAVLFSRGLVNLWYGRQKKLKGVSIGQVWKPKADDASQPAKA